MTLRELVRSKSEDRQITALFVRLARLAQTWQDADIGTHGTHPAKPAEFVVRDLEEQQKWRTERELHHVVEVLRSRGVDIDKIEDVRQFCAVVTTAMDDYLAA